MSLKVNEIFYSLQGESSFAGQPCVFIRLTGCNLRCSYCDTTYAYSKGDQFEINEIVKKVLFYKCSLVEITGGEPLLQNDTPALIHHLHQKNLQVLVETNGTQDINIDHCIKIIDIKCPSSGENSKNNPQIFKFINREDEIKFVIADRRDYDFAKNILASHQIYEQIIHFSPVFPDMNNQILAEWILADHLKVRLQLQLHKIIWGAKRGV